MDENRANKYDRGKNKIVINLEGLESSKLKTLVANS